MCPAAGSLPGNAAPSCSSASCACRAHRASSVSGRKFFRKLSPTHHGSRHSARPTQQLCLAQLHLLCECGAAVGRLLYGAQWLGGCSSRYFSWIAVWGAAVGRLLYGAQWLGGCSSRYFSWIAVWGAAVERARFCNVQVWCSGATATGVVMPPQPIRRAQPLSSKQGG